VVVHDRVPVTKGRMMGNITHIEKGNIEGRYLASLADYMQKRIIRTHL